ncbi:MAG: threonylcarbamoyl-AMP synthase [Phycisphaerales bacterium]|nr:threonylcarbamoyl-AMP synthase [Phycisphaerales bacterium]MCB9835547.1 threonylcarbamoyl-AMP synthase [Phycisphaera sp.]
MIIDDIQAAATILAEGGVVAFPTETVYGLGADALNPDAVAKVFAIKGRPSHNPLIVHVASIEMAKAVASEWPDAAEKLAQTFWPGPLTIVVPKQGRVPSVVTGGGDTVALRMPAHEIARKLIKTFGGPIVGPSANASGTVSPTAASHVTQSLGESVPVLDGGPCERGIESTVVRVAQDSVNILRLGVIGRDEIARVVPVVETHATNDEDPLPSPGMLTRHYAPRTLTRIVDAKDIAITLAQHPNSALLTITPTNLPGAIAMPADASSYAKRLYAALREADAMGADLIIVERPTAIGPIWDAVRDRLRRASAEH